MKKLYRHLTEKIPYCEIACFAGAAWSLRARWQVWIFNLLDYLFPGAVVMAILLALVWFIFL